ncbi:hypothetical protein OKA04_16380 [Luteolibacter flavescens]|uniref:Verru_Chthon cassette protein A n=1 Tax=Luteolibacter flavescens TaxID=1859460 RepID=A0ABT3FRU9_9BACT|nr:hypothetical protein [Luteolibacter flavescens]MCW1886316.1 hypothetical protein [Luteolibacter flavescens]
MPTKKKWTRHPRPRHRGFALVITLSLMVIVTILCVGLLSLSSISLRSGSHGEAMAIARANARLSLALAIGQLQKQAGHDTRVTARADILDEDNPMVLGTWKSWEGIDHESNGTFAGRPISPGNYKSAKEARFQGWLTSSNFDPADLQNLPDTQAGNGKAALVGKGSIGTKAGSEKAQIHLSPLSIDASGQSGGIAWWTGGENQKARLPKPVRPEAEDSPGSWAAVAKSHSVADPKPFGLENLLGNAALADKAFTLRQADLIATADEAKASVDHFHDLSAVSVGLLTNTATGGWRKDMSLLTEAWSNQPSSRLPLFRLTPQKETSVGRPTASSPFATGSMIYPWAAYRSGTAPIYQLGAVSSWENLVNYATFYKRVSTTSTGRFSTTSYSTAISGNAFNFIHKVRILPVIARIQWIFSHSAATTAGATGDALLEPRLLITPVITMWNPYNVEISLPTGNDTNPCLAFILDQPFPTALKYYINGVPNSKFNAVMGDAITNQPSLGVPRMRYSIATMTAMKPGEVRVFSPTNTTPVPSGTTVPLKVGYRTGGGNYYAVKNDQGAAMALPGGTTIKADARFDTEHNQYAELTKPGVGVVLDMQVAGSTDLAYRGICTSAVAQQLYTPLNGLAEATLNDSKTTPKPFLSTMFGVRMASRTHIAAKGFVQSSPMVNYTAMGKDDVEWSIRRRYAGTDHPVNSPFDFSFVAHTPTGDSLLPTDDGSRGHIVTGFTKSDGLSRCIIAELPTRPITSLGELVNWDLRFDNPIPPFALNIIGNSDASPLLPANAVYNAADKGLATNLQYDDSYCANHLLFDDWFFSSIAPDPKEFGNNGRNQRTVFTDLISGLKALPNAAYKPITEDLAAGSSGDSSAAAKLYTDQVAKVDSWKRIASRLEVEGMFNVNSTSVRAWRALLGHARNHSVPQYNEAGTSWNTKLTSGKDHPVTRFSIAGDGAPGESSTSGSFPEANEFAGYRTLDDDFLDALAEEVVAQVRLRGPFLSLSEFVNRQLSSGNLALAGALQTAINETASKSSNNIFANVQGLSSASLAEPKATAAAGYKFPEAAVGYSGYGLPGWTRQADILRPIAPVLTARDDTFTVRGYGDARDSSGKILATAVCEAVVVRTREFINPSESADILTEPKEAENVIFGRRFKQVSFRWLKSEEV